MAMITPRQLMRTLNGHSTQVIIQTFADRILVLVTQMGKVGTLIQASIPEPTPLPSMAETDINERQLPQPPVAIQLTPLLGGAPSEHMRTLHTLFAAQIATIVWVHDPPGSYKGSRRDIIVGLALVPSGDIESVELSDYERNTFRGVMSMVFAVLGHNQLD